jgi:hypothetical protein
MCRFRKCVSSKVNKCSVENRTPIISAAFCPRTFIFALRRSHESPFCRGTGSDDVCSIPKPALIGRDTVKDTEQSSGG